jgi:hypothetical protein
MPPALSGRAKMEGVKVANDQKAIDYIKGKTGYEIKISEL